MIKNTLGKYVEFIRRAGPDGLDPVAKALMKVSLENMGLSTSNEFFDYKPKKVDEALVQKYLKVITPEDVAMINQWTSAADVPIAILIKFQQKIKDIEPVANLKVYRGIGFNLSYQEKMDIYEKKFFMHFLKPGIGVGSEFTYSTPRPLSFTDDIKTAQSFGSTVISATFSKDTKYLRITDAFWEAVNRIDAASLFQEVILLEINKPFKYTVVET